MLLNITIQCFVFDQVHINFILKLECKLSVKVFRIRVYLNNNNQVQSELIFLMPFCLLKRITSLTQLANLVRFVKVICSN